MKIYPVQFEACDTGNMLFADYDGIRIRATVKVPEGASEDYGYLTLKNAVVKELTEHGVAIPEFWYDGQEDRLNEDAAAGTIYETDIDIED